MNMVIDERISDNAGIRCRSEPPLDRHVPVLPVNVSLPVKNNVAGTEYRLKLSTLCDLLEIRCTLGLKQVEAPAKQNRFRC